MSGANAEKILSSPRLALLSKGRPLASIGSFEKPVDNIKTQVNQLLGEVLEIARVQEPINKDDRLVERMNKELKRRAGFILDVATVKLVLGENPSELIDEATEMFPDDKYRLDGSRQIYTRAAQIVAYSGDDEKALKLAVGACKKDIGLEVFPLRYVTEIVHELGRNIDPFLEEYQKLLDKKVNRLGGGFKSLAVDTLLRTVVSMKKIGRDTDEYMQKAEELLQELEPKDKYIYAEYAHAQARLGDVKGALASVEKIECYGGDELSEERTQRQKQKALRWIAHGLKQDGQLDQAFEIAEISNDANLLIDLQLAKALELALNDEDPVDELNKATKLLDIEKKQKVVEVLGEHGRILLISGQEPINSFKAALVYADSHNSRYKNIEALTTIIPVISSNKELAIRAVERALDHFDKGREEKDRSINIGELQSIHVAALEAGLHRFVKQITQRLETFKEDSLDLYNNWKPHFLLKTALIYASWLVEKEQD